MRGKIENGFIGWFDILGFTNLVANSGTKYVVEIIGDILAKAALSSSEQIKELLQELPETEVRNKRSINQSLQNTSWLIFSDTLVLTLVAPALDNDPMRLARIYAFLEQVMSLHVNFLGSGLPLRGAISFGEYYLHPKDSFFAGKSLIEAHKWADAQKWSGCVVTPSEESAFNRIMGLMPKDVHKGLSTYFIKCPAICPNDRRKQERCHNTHAEEETVEMSCLNWPRDLDPLPGNVRSSVESQFALHNKPISDPGVRLKIDNTIEFIKRSRPEWA